MEAVVLEVVLEVDVVAVEIVVDGGHGATTTTTRTEWASLYVWSWLLSGF